MTDYTDAELAEFLAQRARDVHFYADNGLPGYKVMADKYEAAAARLRARSEDTERLDHLERVCTGASSSERYLPFQIYWGDGKGIRAAIDSARKRGE